MFEFAWPWVFIILPLPLLARYLPARQQQQSAALKVPALTPALSIDSHQPQRQRWKLVLAILAWLCLVCAAARPQWLGDPMQIPAKGRDLMVAVDLSGSMKIDDMQLNGQRIDRLEMIKYVLSQFIHRRIGDRVGLILFGDTAYQQAPLTYDRKTVIQLLNEAVIGLVGDQTAIGDAVGLAVKRFEQKKDSSKVLIILTDGQNTAGNISPAEALELAKDKHVTIYTIGVGADKMMVQSFFGTRSVNPSQDLDEKMLTNMAKTTGGRYFRARDTQDLENIYHILDKLEPIARDSRQMRPLKALFFYPLTLALLLSMCLALVPMISNRLQRGAL